MRTFGRRQEREECRTKWLVSLSLALSIALAACSKAPPDDRPWSLPSWDFQDNRSLGVVSVTGTLKGDQVGYKVNTWDIRCMQAEKTCHVANVSEIGRDQLGAITAFDWPILTWTEQVIVATDSTLDTGECSQATITINRVARTVNYDSKPLHPEKDYCKRFSMPQEYHWSIGAPRQPWQK